jgi:hypothetical protein
MLLPDSQAGSRMGNLAGVGRPPFTAVSTPVAPDGRLLR